MKANVLSIEEVEDKYDTIYIQHKCFLVHLPDPDKIWFEKRENHYVADCYEGQLLRRVQDKKALHTKVEIKKASEGQKINEKQQLPLTTRSYTSTRRC